MDAQFDFAVVAGIGALVGLGELVPRYRDAPASAIRTPAAVLYIGVNALASAIALLLTRQLGWEGTSDTNQQTRVLQILVAGFGAMALLRSSLTSVKAGGEIVTAGPGNLLRTVLVAVDEAVDRNRARARSRAIRQIMKGIAFDKSYLPLPLTCFALMQNPREEDKVRLGEATKALMALQSLPDPAKAYLLGLELMNVVGEGVLRAAVSDLSAQIDLSVQDAAALGPVMTSQIEEILRGPVDTAPTIPVAPVATSAAVSVEEVPH